MRCWKYLHKLIHHPLVIMLDYIVQISDLDNLSMIDDVFETVSVKNSCQSSRSCHYVPDKKLPEVIFYFCDLFKLAPEASFFAIELFHEFTRKYIQQFSKQKDKMVSYCTKSTLYVLVCIQISSKMSSHYKAIPQRCVINHLNNMSISRHRKIISKREVITAELEILETVNYDLNFLLPLDVIDIMLYFVQNWLKDNNPKALENCSHLKETCLSILEMVYLRQHQILVDFMKDVPHTDCNQIMLSIAVICVAVFIVDDDLSEILAVFMAEKCKIDHTVLLKLSVCIIENIYNSNTNKFN